jgi:hypothetical protein
MSCGCENNNKQSRADKSIDRRNLLLGTSSIVAAATFISEAMAQAPKAAPATGPAPSSGKPNILMADDIGWFNVSAYNLGVMGYRTPNIDRIAREGALFTDWYGQQSCTAGRAAFITGQSPIRTGLTKVGLPGATIGLHAEDLCVAEALKPLGYATGQFDDVGAFVMTFKDFPPRSFPPSFVPATILEEQLDEIKDNGARAGQRAQSIDKIRSGVNQMIEQQLQQRGVK